jgi:hypothetical protein
MSLSIKPGGDGSVDELLVLHGELQIGQIYKRRVALRPDAQWLWALNGIPEVPPGLGLTGLAPSLDDATAALKERWLQWLASAELSEANGAAS